MGDGCVGRLPIMYMANRPVLWVCYIVSMLLVLIGTLGNILSFRILGYDKSRRKQSSTFYLRALSVADCLSLICNTLFSSQQMMLRPAVMLDSLNPVVLVVNTFPACNIRMFLSSTATMVSVYVIVLFSIERALVLTNPFRWSRLLTLRRAKLAVAALILLSCLLSLPSLFSFNRLLTRHPKRLYNVTTGATYKSRELLDAAICAENATFVGGIGGLNLTEVRPHTGLLSEFSHHRRSNISIQRAIKRNKRPKFAPLVPVLVQTHASSTRSPFRLPTRSTFRLPTRSPSLAPPPLPPQYFDYLYEIPTPPPGIALQCQQVAECRMNFRVFKPFAVFHMVVLSIVPFIITGVCNLLIMWVLRRRDFRELRKAALPKGKGSDSVDRQVTKRLVLVSSTYIALSFPLALFHVVTDAMSGTYCYTWAANALTITITLNSVNFAINFILYCISEDQFRRLLGALLSCRRREMGRLLSYVTRPGKGPGGRRPGPVGGTRPDNAPGPPRSGGGGPAGNKNNNSNITTATNADGPVRQPRSYSELPGDASAAAAEAGTADVQVHNFADCSVVQDDWSSGQFSEGGGSERRKSGLVPTVGWSEVLPESCAE